MLYQWIISLPMMVCFFWSLFFCIRLFRQDDEPRVKGTILIFYIATSVLYTDHWFYFSDRPSFVGEWTYSVMNLCVYPLYYAYLCALTREKKRLELGLLLIPALLIAILFPLNKWLGWNAGESMRIAARICFACLVVWVLVRGYHLLNRTQRRMDDTYSDERSRLLRPLHILLVLFGITAVVSILLNFAGRDFFEENVLLGLPAVIMSTLLFGLGYVAAHTTLPVETVSIEEHNGEDKATTQETDELMYRIATVLREDKLFADSRLTIQDLATAISSNRTYVSNCINRRTGLSFSQYIARYRVEHAQTILCDKRYTSDHDAIAAAIALSGFTSDQTFYRVFKEITGTTPLQYRQQNKQK